jgi:hypothetical protein
MVNLSCQLDWIEKHLEVLTWKTLRSVQINRGQMGFSNEKDSDGAKVIPSYCV